MHDSFFMILFFYDSFLFSRPLGKNSRRITIDFN